MDSNSAAFLLYAIIVGSAAADQRGEMTTDQHSGSDPDDGSMLAVSDEIRLSVQIFEAFAEAGLLLSAPQMVALTYGALHTGLPHPHEAPTQRDDTALKSRSVPLLTAVGMGYLYQQDPARLREAGASIAAIWPSVPAVKPAVIASAYLMKCAMDDLPLDKYFSACSFFVAGLDDGFDQTLRRLGHVLGWGSPGRAVAYLRTEDGLGVSFVLALYCILKYSDNLDSALHFADGMDEHSSLVRPIVAAVVAARLGMAVIPDKLQKTRAVSAYVLEVSSRLSSSKERAYADL